MPRCCKPVVDSCPDTPALDRRLLGPMVAGNHQDQPVTARNRLVQAAIDRCPGRVEVHSMKIENSVGFDRAAAESLVPAAIERSFVDWDSLGMSSKRWLGCGLGEPRGKNCICRLLN